MQRLEWIDRMRGLAILSVVVQHLTYMFANEFVYHKVIGISNMGLFFFISGYLMYLTSRQTTLSESLSFVLKKSRALLLPFLSWGILLPCLVFQNPLKAITPALFVQEWHNPHLWFLLTLFGYSLLFALYRLAETRVASHRRIVGGGNPTPLSDAPRRLVEDHGRV